MKAPKVSIVIPSFNKSRFIRRTLNSIFDQKYKNLEVIIQDGASNDGTAEIIKTFIKKYPNIIKFESKKDDGQLNAVKIGLSKSTGDILTFINADDCYFENAFKNISETYLRHKDAIWFAGQGIVINENEVEIAKLVTLYKNFLLSLFNYYLLLTTNYLIQPSVFFTRETYLKYGPFIGTNNFIMEYDFWLKLGSIQMPVVINKPLSKFRIEATTKTKRLFNDLLTEDEKIVNKYTKNPFILFIHKLNNLGRLMVEKFV